MSEMFFRNEAGNSKDCDANFYKTGGKCTGNELFLLK